MDGRSDRKAPVWSWRVAWSWDRLSADMLRTRQMSSAMLARRGTRSDMTIADCPRGAKGDIGPSDIEFWSPTVISRPANGMFGLRPSSSLRRGL